MSAQLAHNERKDVSRQTNLTTTASFAAARNLSDRRSSRRVERSEVSIAFGWFNHPTHRVDRLRAHSRLIFALFHMCTRINEKVRPTVYVNIVQIAFIHNSALENYLMRAIQYVASKIVLSLRFSIDQNRSIKRATLDVILRVIERFRKISRV